MQGGTTIDQARSSGFTIIEIMLFLAISGLLFVATIADLAHKQSTTEFDVGLNTFVSQLQSIVNEIGNGNYNYSLPSGDGCTTSANEQGDEAPSITPGNVFSPDCVFLGEALSFSEPDSNGEQTYYTLPIMGNRYQDGSGPQEASTLAGARPTTTLNLAQPTVMPNGLEVKEMYYQTSTAPDSSQYIIASFGWLTSLGSYTGTGSMLQSGAQSLILAPIPPGSQLTSTDDYLGESTAITNINYLTDACSQPADSYTICTSSASPNYNTNTSMQNPPTGIIMCVGNGSESAQLTIGGESSITNVAVQRFNSTDCT